MPYLRSANVSQFPALTGPGAPKYHHGVDKRQGYIPLAFQVTSPFDKMRALLPHALIAHVNPMGFNETFTKKVERIQTKGGFVEQHWGDDLGEISVDMSTGAFINLYTGLTSVLRHRTIAWDRYRDLYDLYRNNGSVYDPFGNIVLQGNILLMYDRGTYDGSFRSFTVEETDESPFAFKVSWTFKVETVHYQIPQNAFGLLSRPASFQSQNQSNAALADLPSGQTASQYQQQQQAQREQQVADSRVFEQQLQEGKFGNPQASDDFPSPEPEVGGGLTSDQASQKLFGPNKSIPGKVPGGAGTAVPAPKR